MTTSNQRYLKAIYTLSLHDGSTRVVDIADTLSVSKASVCSALQRLEAKGYVYHEFYGDVRLSAFGEKKAKAMIASYERLRAALGEEALLPEGLGYLFARMPEKSYAD